MQIAEVNIKKYDEMIQYFHQNNQPLITDDSQDKKLEQLEKENEELKSNLFSIQTEADAKNEELRYYEKEIRNMIIVKEKLEHEVDEGAKLKQQLAEEYDKKEILQNSLSELKEEHGEIEKHIDNFITQNNLLNPKQTAEYQKLVEESKILENQLEEETQQQLEVINDNLSKSLKKEQIDRVDTYIEYVKYEQKWEFVLQQRDQNNEVIKCAENQMRVLKEALALMKGKLLKLEPLIKKMFEFLKQNSVISDSFLSDNSFDVLKEL